MMDCQHATQAMQEALDAGRTGRLPGAVQAHLDVCVACRTAWAEMACLEGGLGEVALRNDPLPSPMLHRRLMAAVREEERHLSAARRTRRAGEGRRMLAAAAMLLVVLCAGVLVKLQSRPSTMIVENTPPPAQITPGSAIPVQIDLTEWIGNPKQDLKELASAILATTSGVIDVGALSQADNAASPQATPSI